jgi:hypothetical protein
VTGRAKGAHDAGPATTGVVELAALDPSETFITVCFAEAQLNGQPDVNRLRVRDI